MSVRKLVLGYLDTQPIDVCAFTARDLACLIVNDKTRETLISATELVITSLVKEGKVHKILDCDDPTRDPRFGGGLQTYHWGITRRGKLELHDTTAVAV